MDLLGWPAIVVTVVLVAVGLFGGTIAQHQVRGRRLPQLLLRLLITLLSCLLVVMGIAVELNRENGWFATWGDLTGRASTDAGGTQVTVKHHRPGSAPTATGNLPSLPRPGQRVQQYQVTGPEGITNQVNVLLPLGYEDPANANRRYPVLVLGHGMPGSLRQWLGPMDIRKHLDPLVAAGKFAPAIVVMPQLEAPGGVDTECITSATGADDAMEQWLANDVPDFVQSHFRTQSGAGAWATMGFSAGGWCAAMLTMLHPDQFGSAMVLGGYFQPWWAQKAPWSSSSTKGHHYDLYRLAANNPPDVDVWVQSSLQDQESGAGTARFAKAAKPPLHVTEVMDPTGGHRTSVWDSHVSQALQWLAATRPAFAAS